MKNAHTIEDLAGLFDNITDYIFNVLNNNNALTQRLILVTNQHAVVLDYVTASQGGLCQIVGPACCHFLNFDEVLQVQHDIEQAKKLKEVFRRTHSQEDWNPNLPEWLSWLYRTAAYCWTIVDYLLSCIFYNEACYVLNKQDNSYLITYPHGKTFRVRIKRDRDYLNLVNVYWPSLKGFQNSFQGEVAGL